MAIWELTGKKINLFLPNIPFCCLTGSKHGTTKSYCYP